MFAIHGKIELLKRDGRPLGTYARHYYDLFQLAGQQEVIAMLKADEYAAIKADYDRISSRHFERSYFPPENLSFAKSDTLFPPADIAQKISTEYEGQCRLPCYKSHPSWREVQDRLLALRELL